jgi:hypothetical protein
LFYPGSSHYKFNIPSDREAAKANKQNKNEKIQKQVQTTNVDRHGPERTRAMVSKKIRQ